MSGEAPQYIAARVQRALAEDERTSEQGIRVDIRENQLFLRGEVHMGVRRDMIAAVAHEAAPELTVRNEITVVEPRAPEEEESL